MTIFSFINIHFLTLNTRLIPSHGSSSSGFPLFLGGENNLTSLSNITTSISSLTKKENSSSQSLLSIVLISSTLLPNCFGLKTKLMNGRLFPIVFPWIMIPTLSCRESFAFAYSFAFVKGDKACFVLFL